MILRKGNSLAPVQGALTSYLESMRELTDDPEMPQVVAHEYAPLMDSSDMGPGDWALLAKDIETNYYHFDGFVILMVRISMHTVEKRVMLSVMSHSLSIHSIHV